MAQSLLKKIIWPQHHFRLIALQMKIFKVKPIKIIDYITLVAPFLKKCMTNKQMNPPYKQTHTNKIQSSSFVNFLFLLLQETSYN